jgi:hypothetical protein
MRGRSNAAPEDASPVGVQPVPVRSDARKSDVLASGGGGARAARTRVQLRHLTGARAEMPQTSLLPAEQRDPKATRHEDRVYGVPEIHVELSTTGALLTRKIGDRSRLGYGRSTVDSFLSSATQSVGSSYAPHSDPCLARSTGRCALTILR